jgi:hypothetical protein
MVHAIDLNIDNSVKRELRNLAVLQDTWLQAIKGGLTNHSTTGTKYIVNNEILYCKEDKEGQNWKVMLPECLEQKIMKFVHASLGHLRSDKCYAQIKDPFHFRNLGRKLRKFIAACDLCQRTKHMNRVHGVKEKHHLPKSPGELGVADLYGSLPTSRGNIRYIFVCYEVFSKYVKLYPLKSATTKACLNKLLNHYFVNVIEPKIILSDNGSQLRSSVWLKKLKEHDVTTRFLPIRHPESNPSERVMRELSKFFSIYCHNSHKKWVELLPHIEGWLNKTVANSTGYSPLELMFGNRKPSIFDNTLPELKQNPSNIEDLDIKLERAFSRIKRKAEERARRRKKGDTTWNSKLEDRVLIKGQNQSVAAKGMIDKFMHVYQGPYIINKI